SAAGAAGIVRPGVFHDAGVGSSSQVAAFPWPRPVVGQASIATTIVAVHRQVARMNTSESRRPKQPLAAQAVALAARIRSPMRRYCHYSNRNEAAAACSSAELGGHKGLL